MKKITLFLIVLSILFNSCRDDIDEFNADRIEDPIIVLIESSITGEVVDEFGVPVSNAVVQVSGKSVMSDNNGRFKFEEVEIKKNGDIVKAKSDQHFEGVSHARFTADGDAFIEISMIEKGSADLIDPTIEQVLTKSSGLEITIPPNSILSSNGEAYEGTVKTYARWIDPTDKNVAGIMPGALNAINSVGEERVLATYGMLALALESESGEELFIDNDAKLNTKIPIPPDLLDQAPEDMPLWEYDLEEGQWLENGACAKEGAYYVCAIPGTGYWNCDVPLEAICLSAQIYNQDGTAASYLKVVIEDLTDNFIYWGYTDLKGYFCGSVPRAAPLKITIKDHCDNVIYMEEIGPYSDDFQLEDIFLDENLTEYFVKITGTLSHCITTDVPSGHLGVSYPGTLAVFPFENGAFDIDLGLKCTDFPEIELTVYSTTEEVSTETGILTFDGDVNLGTLTACEDLDDSFKLIVDGVNYFASPTQYYLKPSQTTDWMVMEGLSGAGKFILELRDYQGVGQYTSNVFFESVNEALLPEFINLEGASPDVTVDINSDDGVYIEGSLLGVIIDNNNEARNISGDFKIKKAP